jgi:hypothetical protein
MDRSLAEQAVEALERALGETHPGDRDRLMDRALRLRRLAAAEAGAARVAGEDASSDKGSPPT